jgi:type II secretion system protein D
MALPPANNPQARPAMAPAAPQGTGFTPAAGLSDARLQVYDIPTESVGSAALLLQSQFGSDRRVRITTEPNSGRLMVLAPDATQRQIAVAVEAIKKQTGTLATDPYGRVIPNTVQSRQYKLQKITWRELEDGISRIAGSKLSIATSNNGELAQLNIVTESGPREIMTIDRRNDEVRLQGSPQDVLAWTQVVTAVDLAQIDPQRPTQIVPINPATPERIERALSLVRKASYQQPLQDEAVGTAQFNPQQNPNGQQDDENAPGMAVGSPDNLNSNTGLIGDVDISFVPEMGLVIVKGGKRDVQRVLEVIEQIKKQSSETQPEIEVYPLKHVNGVALEPVLKDLNDKVFSPRQGQISIYALGQPNSLLLIGRPEALTGIKELIVKLDQPLDPNNQLRVFRLINSSAVDAETLVRNFFSDTGTGAQGGAPGATTSTTQLNTRVKVVADYRTNSLIVQASPRDIAEVARLILEIDVESTPAENEIRVFPIKNAVAADLQPILQSAINGTSTGSTNTQQGGFQQQQQQSSGSGRSTPPSSRLSIVAREGAEVNSGILAGVVITSNPSINTLIVRAPSKSMPLIAALIDQLDQLPSAEARMKVYPVVNGDATSLVTIIQQAFGLPATGTNTNQQQGAGLFGLQNLAALVGGGESSLVPLRISADTRTNTIIASGGASDLDVIEALLYRLDEAGGNQRTTEVIWLRNANAADVNVALTNLFQGQRTLAQTLTTQGFNQQNQQVSLFERADREVLTIFVSPESSTNSIIVSATPRYMKQIREVIERLDRQQPMIFVEMLIAEVALTDQFEMGTELGLQDSLLFDRNSATGGTLGSPVFNILTPLTTAAPQRRVANVAGQGSSGFSLGRTSGDLGYGGLVLAASSESVGLLFRMLQDANRAQVLARPTLTTIDNNISVVNVGKSVPILGNSTNTVSGVTQSVQYINTGLTMQIQPRTNQDGLINMIVAISRSSVSDADSLTIANGDQTSTTPAFNQTLAQTRVTAYDGQTVVLGGLITKERVSQSRRIPWLADIPIAGALFRFDKETEARTELLVVMTPRVINFNDPNKLDMIKQVESSRMSWCLADVLNVYSDQGLSAGNGLWGPATSPVIYPDVTPTVDRENDPNCQPGAPNYIQPSDSYIQPSDSYIQPMEGQMLLEDPSQSNPPMLIEPNGFNSSRSQPRSILQLESSEGSGVVNPARPMQNSSYIPVVPNGNGQVVQTNYVPVSPMLPPAPNAVNPAAGSRK